MKVKQTSWLQTGVLIAEIDGKIRHIPLFTENLQAEAMEIEKYFDRIEGVKECNSLFIFAVYLNTSKDYTKNLIKEVEQYKRKYHVLPKYLMNEVRTGFKEYRTLGTTVERKVPYYT